MSRIADSTFSEVHLGTEEAPEAVELETDRPFRLLLVGDFSGRSEASPRSFKPQRIDRDSFDEVLERMKVAVDLPGMTLSFRELEDFHPDRIYRSAGIFKKLDSVAGRGAPAAAASAPSAQREVPASGLLDQILAEHEPEHRAASVKDADDLASFIRGVTRGHLVPREDPAKQQSDAKRQELAAEVLRGILHHPRMQAREAAWRALFKLVHELDTDGDLHLYMLDITLPELTSEMDAVRETLRGKGSWALIAGNYTFGQSKEDVQALRRLAGLASSLGAPFIAEARLSGDEGTGDAWQELRRSREARWLGLAIPRFLLRLPYGKTTDSIESFPFEEMPKSDHSAYLWGNPAFLCAHLIAESFLANGWELGGRLARRLDGLPLHVYRDDGESVAKPCAEVLMTEHDAESLLESGIMPVVSIKNEPAALLLRFQSIAQPLAPLAGLA